MCKAQTAYQGFAIFLVVGPSDSSFFIAKASTPLQNETFGSGVSRVSREVDGVLALPVAANRMLGCFASQTLLALTAVRFATWTFK